MTKKAGPKPRTVAKAKKVGGTKATAAALAKVLALATPIAKAAAAQAKPVKKSKKVEVEPELGTPKGITVVSGVTGKVLKKVKAPVEVKPVVVAVAKPVDAVKTPCDRSDAAKRAWITIRANRAAAAAAASA